VDHFGLTKITSPLARATRYATVPFPRQIRNAADWFTSGAGNHTSYPHQCFLA